MLKSTLSRYKLGLAIIGAFVLVLLFFVLVQANANKQDIETNKAAADIASKLDDYILTNDAIPDSLGEARIDNVPPAIHYEKLTDKKYKFCVTYKSAANNFDAQTAVIDTLSGGAVVDRSAYAGGETLYISPAHGKGEQCQTVAPYFYNLESSELEFDSLQGSSLTGGPYAQCGEGYNYVMSLLNVQNVSTTSIKVDTYPNTTTLSLDPKVKVFDASCKPLTLNDIKVGDFVSLYFNPYGNPVSMIIKS